MKYAYIIDVLRKLKKKYGTLDIYELCEKMGILIHYYPMGKNSKSGKGFFTRQSKIRVITVNSDLSGIVQKFVIAHELGHAVLHYDPYIQMFRDMVLFDETAVTELEANLFAAEILLGDEDVIRLLRGGISFFETAAALNVPAELLDFKLRMMRTKGFALAMAPITADSRFLKDLQVPENHDLDPA